MTVRRPLLVLCALCGLVSLVGCGRGDGGVQIAEVDEPTYQTGKQLLKKGREAEALAAFLKVIEQRGDRAAPESNFEAGLLYLRHMKDPVAAIYHLKKYADYPPPNSRQVQSVRDLINTARREFAATLPGTLLEDRSSRLESAAEIEALRRENEELRTEIATLRGGANSMVTRASSSLSLSLDPAPARAGAASPAANPNQGSVSPGGANSLFSPAPTRPTEDVFRPAPTPGTPARGGATAQRGGATAAPSGRTHTVKPQESLYGIAKKYNVTLEALQRANGINDAKKISQGAVLKIP